MTYPFHDHGNLLVQSSFRCKKLGPLWTVYHIQSRAQDFLSIAPMLKIRLVVLVRKHHLTRAAICLKLKNTIQLDIHRIRDNLFQV